MKSNWLPVILSLILLVAILDKMISHTKKSKKAERSFQAYIASEPAATLWTTPWNKYQIPMDTDSGKLICYGLQLISNTSYYLGPKGKVAQITNGLNCQNCHLMQAPLHLEIILEKFMPPILNTKRVKITS